MWIPAGTGTEYLAGECLQARVGGPGQSVVRLVSEMGTSVRGAAHIVL